MVEVKTEKSKEILPILITENKTTQSLLGLDWLDKLEIGLQGSKKTNVIRHVEEDERRKKIIDKHEDLFKNSHTIKDLTIDIQLKKDVKPIQQKGRPVPIQFQKSVREELEKLIESGHLEKTDKTTENCFISPAVITIKKDKSVKIALDSRKLNEACVKRKKSSNAEYGRANQQNFSQNYKRRRRDLDVKDRLRLRLRPGEYIQGSSQTLCVFDNWGRLYRTLLFQEGFLRPIRHSHGVPRTHRHRDRVQNTSLA